MTHAYGHWRYLLLHGRAQKRIRENPTRTRQAMRKALNFLRIRYREMPMIRNPLFDGYKHDVPNAPQWLDFVVFNKKMGVVLFKKRPDPRHDQQMTTKLAYLEQRGVPVLVVPYKKSYMEYVVLLQPFLRELEYHAKQQVDRRTTEATHGR